MTVDRGAALFSSWYEIFPRSQSGTTERHGTFDDVIARLPAIQAMGFDTLYFPPIHPIGRVNRKGKNNSTRAEPGEPGSPYAIGSAEGGHDAIHPELGTIEDFRRLRDSAAAHGLELALDFAIQCAPDHPWLKEHPEWFAWRPDGTIAYAENPPKKYEDIVNVDFYAPGAVPGLWLALRDIMLYWRMEGVRTFRVDNPHTKPLPFWRWVIADIRARFPDTIFLSEAFTRPQVMYQLAKIGFSQSYTYFTWRNTKAELESYMTELTSGPPKNFFRPHFFVNTPDINPVFLQRSGRAGFLIRAALASTLSGLWGVYNGFELCEGTPLPGKEEYLDSEKYEIRAWDWNRPGNIVAEISQLNRIRRRNPALQTHLGIRFITAANDNVIAFIKSTPERDNVILVAINLDPFNAQDSWIEIPLWEWSLPDHASIDVEDLIAGSKFQWHGKSGTIRLDPYELPYVIWRIAVPAGETRGNLG
jgi:starch synthase (maltosyl-transferring)